MRRRDASAPVHLAIYPASDIPERKAAVRGTMAPDGSYALGGLARGAWVLVATDGAGNHASERFEIPVAGLRVACDLCLRPARAAIRGRVLRADGTAWAGTVGATSYAGALARVDAEGRFSLEGLPVGDCTVVGWTDAGAWWTSHLLELPTEQELLVDLGALTLAARGRIVDDDTSCPVAGAVLEIRGDGGPARGEMSCRTTTDATGAFHFRRPRRASRLCVAAPGYARASWLMDERSTTEVRLVRPGRIVGRVVLGDDGQPVVGATVEAHGATSDPPVRTATGRGGCFRLTGLAPGEYVLTAHGAGVFMEAMSPESNPDARLLHVAVTTGREVEQDVVMQRSGRVEGTVRDDQGRAVPGARVLGPDPGGEGVITDDAGSFVLPSVPPGRRAPITLGEAAGMRSTGLRPASIDIRAGVTSRVTLRCRPDDDWPRLHVVVTDPDGAPIDRVYVRWGPEGGGGETGPDGTVLLLAKGFAHASPVFVTAAAEGFIDTALRVIVPEDDRPPIELRLTLRRALLLEGHAVDLEGRPVPGVDVVARGPNFGFARSKTNVDGRFGLWVPGAGPWAVGGASLTRGVESLTPIEVKAPAVGLRVVQRPEADRGREVQIVGPDGCPVPSAECFVRRAGGERSPTWTVEGGSTHIRDASDPLEVVVHSARDAGGRPFGVGAARVKVHSTDRTIPLRITLPKERTVEGHVVDGCGRRVRGMRVLAKPRSRPALPTSASSASPARPQAGGEDPHAAARTDREGRFCLSGLGSEAYEVHVDTSTQFLATDPMLVPEGQGDVTFVLRPALDVTVTVVDAHGTPVPDARVQVSAFDSRGAARAMTRKSDLDGRVRVRGMDPRRRHALHATPPEGMDTSLPTTLLDWKRATGTVVLADAMRVRVLLVDGEGLRYGNYLLCDREGRRPLDVRPITPDGGRISVIAQGTYTIDAIGPELRGDLLAARATFQITPESSDVVVVWPGGPLRAYVSAGRWPRGLQAWVARLEGDEVVASAHVTLHRDRFELPGLDPAHEYVLLLEPDVDGRSALLGPVNPRSNPYDLLARETPLRTGNLLLPTGAVVTRVYAGAPATLLGQGGRTFRMPNALASPVWPGALDASGSFVIQGVPEGEVTIAVEWTLDGMARVSHGTHTGPPIEIPLHPR